MTQTPPPTADGAPSDPLSRESGCCGINSNQPEWKIRNRQCRCSIASDKTFEGGGDSIFHRFGGSISFACFVIVVDVEVERGRRHRRICFPAILTSFLARKILPAIFAKIQFCGDPPPHPPSAVCRPPSAVYLHHLPLAATSYRYRRPSTMTSA